MEAFGFFHNQCAFLIASIIQKNRNWCANIKSRDLFQELAYTLSGNVGVIGNRNHFMRNCVECAQDIETLTTGWRWYKNTRY